MRTLKLLAIVLAITCFVATAPVQAQCPSSTNSLSTGFAGGNGQSGNMFDIVCTNPANVLIESFECHLDPGTWDMEIFVITGGGSFVGQEMNPAAWTSLGTATGVVGMGAGVPTVCPIPVNVVIANGGTQGFYLTNTNGFGFSYTNGTQSGLPSASDGNIQVLEGTGNAYPFGSFFGSGAIGGTSTRIWNGNVCYTVGGTPPPAEFQTNTSAADLRINGASVNSLTETVVTVDVESDPLGATVTPGTGNLSLSSDVPGALYDILTNGLTLNPLTSGGIQLTPGNIVNLDVVSGFSSLNSGMPLSVSLQGMPGNGIPGNAGGSFTSAFSLDAPAAPATVSVQGVLTNPASAAGFSLTGATRLDVTLSIVFPPYSACPSTIGGDLAGVTDDNFVTVPLAATGFSFYGVNYTDVHVGSNGFLTFVTGDSDFSQTEAEFLSDQPRIAPAWADWSPNDLAQGIVRTFDDGIVFSCEWFDVRGFGSTSCGPAIDTNTFCATLIYATGDIIMEYGIMQLCNNGSNPQTPIVGISPGGSLSLPNNVDLTLGGNAGALATDAVYEDFGQAVFGPFDIGGPGSGPANSYIWTAGAPGAGPYTQN